MEIFSIEMQFPPSGIARCELIHSWRIMFINPGANWYGGNQTHSQPACEHCGRGGRHENWCVTCNPVVQYAYRVVTDPGKLTLRDRLILHALGVAWGNEPYEGEFQQTTKISPDRELVRSSLRAQVRGH
jgi:hypothetical protein